MGALSSNAQELSKSITWGMNLYEHGFICEVFVVLNGYVIHAGVQRSTSQNCTAPLLKVRNLYSALCSGVPPRELGKLGVILGLEPELAMC